MAQRETQALKEEVGRVHRKELLPAAGELKGSPKGSGEGVDRWVAGPVSPSLFESLFPSPLQIILSWFPVCL